MKTSVKNISETKVELTIAVGPSELEAAEQVALKKLSRDIKVPGFRKGKVPISVAEKHVNPAALQEQTLENALSKAVAEAFMSEKLQAIDRPEVDVKKFVPGKELEFTAEAEIIPKVALGDYKKLKTKREKVEVKDEDIEDIITRIQQNTAAKKDVERAAKLGDEVVIDFVGKKDGEAFDGGTAEGYTLKLGDGQFIPGFEEGVVGHKPGEKFDLELTFPKDYHAKELAGQKVVFETTLRTVFELSLPELDDEFAAKSGPFTSMDELREDIKREVASQREREVEEKYKDALIGELADASKTALPELLIEDQIRSIEQDMSQNLAYRGMTLESYFSAQGFDSKDDWMKKEVRPAAEKRVKAGLVLSELSKELEVDVSREELLEQINIFRQQYGKDAKTAAQFDDPNVHRDIANRMITDKTIAKLVEIVDKK